MKGNGIGLRILVNDFKKCRDFYHNILGFEYNWGTEDSEVYVNFKTKDGVYFSLFKKQNNTMYEGYEDIGNQVKSDYVTISISVEDAKDVDALYEELVEKGIETMGKPRDMTHWGFRCLWFRDPEGNMLEFGGPLKEKNNE